MNGECGDGTEYCDTSVELSVSESTRWGGAVMKVEKRTVWGEDRATQRKRQFDVWTPSR